MDDDSTFGYTSILRVTNTTILANHSPGAVICAEGEMYTNGPYVVPLAYLPVDSAVPAVPPVSTHDKRIVVTTTIEASRLAITSILRMIRTDILAPAELDAWMNHTAAVVQAAGGAAAASLRVLAASVSRESSDALTTSFISSSKRPEYRQAPINYVVYDTYFRVIRVEKMSSEQFLGQILTTFAATLADLSYAHLSLAEVEALLAAMDVSLRSQLQTPSTSEDTRPTAYPDALALQDDRAGYWFLDGLSSASRRIRNHVVGTYRWIVGHHTFAIFSMLCADSLRQIDVANPTLASTRLMDAATLLRGTTAAMWYAAAMPARVYCDDLRSQMISTNSPAGFSGAQNIEYERLKESKDEFLKTVRETWLADTKWTSKAKPATQSLMHFLEIDLEDLEHHILIASQLVGTQAVAIADQLDEPDSSTTSAVTQLRHVLKKRRDVYDEFMQIRQSNDST